MWADDYGCMRWVTDVHMSDEDLRHLLASWLCVLDIVLQRCNLAGSLSDVENLLFLALGPSLHGALQEVLHHVRQARDCIGALQ